MKSPEIPVFPKYCPECNSTLVFDGIHLTCNNDKCIGKIKKKLASGCALLDLKGVGGKTIEPFAKDFKSMYELFTYVKKNKNKIDLEPYGIKNNSRSYEIFIDAFLNIQSITYAQVILLHGYDRVGIKLAEQVAIDYCDGEPEYKGHEKMLVEMFKDEDIKTFIKTSVSFLEYLGVIVDKPNNNINNLNNMELIYVCMTGSPKKFGFKTKAEFISKFPNTKEVSITDIRCNYLITDNLYSTTSKMKTAEKRGIPIVTYNNFKNK